MNKNRLAMFEIMATDQDKLIDFYHHLFGWTVQRGSQGFAYIHFPPPPAGGYPVMGGIGQAQPGVPGMERGTAFYIEVDSVQDTLDRAVGLGGTQVMPSSQVDGYTFGMFNDPEGNLIGIMEPFAG